MSTSTDALYDQIDAANAEIERIKLICSEIYNLFCTMVEGQPYFDEQFEIAMRDVLGLSKSAPPVKIDEKDIPY